MKPRPKQRFAKAVVAVLGIVFLGWWVYALSPEVRCLAAAALGRVGPRAAPLLVRMMGDRDGPVTAAAINALTEIGPGAVPALTEALTDQDAAIRRWAATTLGGISPPASQAVPTLWERLDAEDDSLAHEAVAGALGRIGRGDTDIRQKLIGLLGRPEARLRAGAAEALGQMREFSRPAIPALIQALRDADRNVREEAKEALERIGRTLYKDDPALREQIDAAIGPAKTVPDGGDQR
jgi:HEAT repeat protein